MKHTQRITALGGLFLPLLLVPALANPICETSLQEYQTAFAQQSDNLTQEDAQKVANLIKVLEQDCQFGSNEESVSYISNQIKTLLNME
ncbi:hypothetical protein [Paraferrimonas sp. SM1919]|uniref:hypothetical protein n=1 Tax=Paraferrimonas sp. SM1919 TaxID=2662263 RepID=UPI0013D8BB77|nr:hypothetical protein [Paraferrimonas sp. SM1919]